MGEVKYVKVNVTALKAAMIGFKAGVSTYADSDTKEIVNLFEEMILSYITNDERKDEDDE